VLAPLLTILRRVNEQLTAGEHTIEPLAEAKVVAERWGTTPGVGPVTALVFVATGEEVARFESAHQ
jgi:hypothetical protein